jgi:hypothetical protein
MNGISCSKTLKVIETIMTYNQEQDMSHLQFILKQEDIQRFLARKYLQNGIKYLREMKSPNDYSRL